MKINDYEIRGAAQDLIDFKDQVTLLLNNGKYSSLVVSTPPTWTARNGEFVFFNSASTLRIYFYNNTSWGFIEYPAGGGVLITAVSNNVTTVSNTLLNVSNNLVAVSNNLTTASTTILNASNSLVAVSNNLTTASTTILNASNSLVAVSNNLSTASTTLLNVSNNLVAVSNNLTTASTTILNVSNNLVGVSNNLTTASTTILNVSNNLVTVSNNQATEATRLTNVSNNLVTASGNIANLIVQVTNGALKGWIQFSGTGSLSIDDHYNVASLTRHAQGIYSIVWTTTLANKFYSFSGLGRRGDASALTDVLAVGISSLTMGSSTVMCQGLGGLFVDANPGTFMLSGDQ